jgi:hypothetical protein
MLPTNRNPLQECAHTRAVTNKASVGGKLFWREFCQLPGRMAIASVAKFGKIYPCCFMHFLRALELRQND